MSKNKKLYCKTCNMFFEVKLDQKEDYMMIKVMKPEESDLTPYVLKTNPRKNNYSSEYRKAYEDYFSGSEE
ncbi:MAG: hypothetical protein JW891_13805 [Candidatus Lokiarchaeota archaeon]|nr:hypothetical protein [Candidatus Lokiarchaeota archaeon]